jgi:hypothetical protein
MNSPEWIIILIGCIICAMNGATQTVLTILIAKIVSVSDLANYVNSMDVLFVI